MQTKNSDGGCGTPSHQQFEGEKSKCPMSEHVMGNVSQLDDPFTALRQGDGVLDIDDQGDPVKMVLGLKDVRKAAHSWQLFQSGAIPGRIVVPSEVAIRDIRQLPFELDPPAHKGFRGLLEPWFKRPAGQAYQDKLTDIVSTMLDSILDNHTVINKRSSPEMITHDAVKDIALVLQSRALTVLINVPMTEAQTWINWGTHVFRSDDNPLDASKANVLYDYLDEQIAHAKKAPGEDIYTELLHAEVEGKALTEEEIKGIMILTFAGGRDTVINALTNSLAYFSENPDALNFINEHPENLNSAIEELLRYFSPLTHMGRVATKDTQVAGHDVAYDSRISLCWASANRDESVFESPNEVNLTRKANPHVAFGFGIHNCLGATHARALLRIWVGQLAERVARVEVVEADENTEQWGEVARKVGFHKLLVRLHKRA
jgi:cytochrome P450